MKNMLIFDGGFGTEAVINGYVKNDDPLWSSRMLINDHASVLNIHTSFLEAGADAISSNTYQASINGFINATGCSVGDAQAYIRTGARLAKQACLQFNGWKVDGMKQSNFKKRREPLACASLGPYGVSLCDASEYHGNYVNSVRAEELKSWHNSKLSVLAEEELDLYMFETIPALAEAEAILPLVREYPNLKFTISFSCKDGSQLCHGDDIKDAIELTNRYDSVVAVGINCTSPLYISELVSKISKFTSKDILVMPNSGEQYEDKKWLQNEKVKPLYEYVPEWMKNGANWIGGCCRTRPADICLVREVADGVMAISNT